MNELIALRQLLAKLITNSEINETAKINLGFADFSLSQAILAQSNTKET